MRVNSSVLPFVHRDIVVVFNALYDCNFIMWSEAGLYETHNTVFFSKWLNCVFLMLTDTQIRLSPVTMIPNSSSFKIEKMDEYFKIQF